MIRLILILSFAFFCSAAQATTPRVGDFAKFDTTLYSQGRTIYGSIQIELLEQDGGKFLQRLTMTVPGRPPKVKEDWKAQSDFVDDQTINSALTNCASIHGIRELLRVPAGTFDSCAIPMDNDSAKGTIWVARVPMGVVRTESTSKSDSTEMIMELREAH